MSEDQGSSQGFFDWWIRNVKPSLRNPGKFEDADRAAKDVIRMPELFDGFKFEGQRAVYENFQVLHSITLGPRPPEQSMYTFSANFFSSGLLMGGRMDSDMAFGRMEKTFRLPNHWSADVKFSAQVARKEDDNSGAEFEIGLKTDQSSTALKAMSSGLYALSRMQAITPSLSLGAEYAHSAAQGFSGLTAVLCARKPEYTWAATLSTLGSASFAFARIVQKGITFAVNVEAGVSPQTGELESTCALGWEYQLFLSRVKAQVDTKMRVKGYYEYKFHPLFSLAVCGEVDYLKADSKFGVGLNFQS